MPTQLNRVMVQLDDDLLEQLDYLVDDCQFKVSRSAVMQAALSDYAFRYSVPQKIKARKKGEKTMILDGVKCKQECVDWINAPRITRDIVREVNEQINRDR